MPRYRLIADHGHAVESFEAADDAAAEEVGRSRSPYEATAKKTGYRVEREDDGSWRTVAAWMPRRVRETEGSPDDLVSPAAGSGAEVDDAPADAPA